MQSAALIPPPFPSRIWAILRHKTVVKFPLKSIPSSLIHYPDIFPEINNYTSGALIRYRDSAQINNDRCCTVKQW